MYIIAYTDNQGRDQYATVLATFKIGCDIFHTIHVPNFGFRVIREDICADDEHPASGTDVTDQKY